jgi:hypothetical protein
MSGDAQYTVIHCEKRVASWQSRRYCSD